MINTSVTLPNMPKYSLSLSADVCQLSPPTNNLPGAESALFGVERPDEPECDGAVPFCWPIDVSLMATNALCMSGCIRLPFSMVALHERNENTRIHNY